jgi:histidyl-tRNA synthetase
MNRQLKAIRGMNDILPMDTPYWHQVERIAREIANGAGYDELRTPLLEYTELFTRSIGDETDIVSKEMYTFLDRNDESLSLRPEGTACCVRAGIENGLFYNQIQRWWYSGPMFRYEKPQKGRYRQFYQFGVEAYGIEGPAIEAELLAITADLWSRLGLSSVVRLQLNHLGTKAMRMDFREALVQYLKAHQADLDPDSQRRLDTNPLRILDSKDPKTQSILNEAPKLGAYWDRASKDHLQQLQSYLKVMGIACEINERLVRGLDYYDGIVFEWVTTELGAQGTVCAGGRYDGLVEQLGGQPTPAVGFGCGLERLVLLRQNQEKCVIEPDLYVLVLDETLLSEAFSVVKQLREALPQRRIIMNLSGGKIKNQFKRADKSMARYALLIGEIQCASQQYILKPLRTNEAQSLVTVEECIAFFRERFA